MAFTDTVDIEKSLAIFRACYDALGQPISSSAYLNGRWPQLPRGVLRKAQEEGADWVTWQPQHHVRMAVGVLRVNTVPASYIAVGRSLRGVEEKESRLVMMVLAAWLACIFILCLHLALQYSMHRKKIIA